MPQPAGETDAPAPSTAEVVVDRPRVTHETLLVFASCGASALVMAGIGGIPVAMPFIGSDLRSSQSELQWISDITPLVLAALLLPAGAVLDRYGRKRGMVLGMIIMTGAMVWSGLCDSALQLIVSRGLAGLGAALVFPGTLATISSVLPSERRGLAVGFWALSVVVGAAFGFVLVGVLMSFWWWGSIFLTLAGLSAIVLVLILAVVPETVDPEHANFDPPGVVLSVIGVGALVLAVAEGPIHGWFHPFTIMAAGTGLLALTCFVGWELRCARPLIDLRVLRDPAVGAASVTLLVMMAVDYGLFFLFFMYESYILGYSPLRAAAGLIAICWPAVPLGIFGPAIARRFGKRVVMSTALLLCAGGTGLVAAFGDAGTYWSVAPGMVLFMCGLGLAIAPPTETILQALPAAQQGLASAINDLVRELGAAFGIAILGSAFNAGYRDKVTELLTGRDDAVADAIHKSPAAGLEAAPDGVERGRIVDIIHIGFHSGFEIAGTVATIMLIAAAVFVGIRHPSKEVTSGIRVEESPQVGPAVAI